MRPASRSAPRTRQQQEMNKALDKLKQLAQRQQELAAQAAKEQSFRQRWEQEMLRREAEELKRQMEQLQRGDSSQQNSAIRSRASKANKASKVNRVNSVSKDNRGSRIRSRRMRSGASLMEAVRVRRIACQLAARRKGRTIRDWKKPSNA